MQGSGSGDGARTRAHHGDDRVSAVTRDFLSARARVALARHQREVMAQMREMQTVDRVLNGALSACDAATQRESVENYLETVQELRVSLQRLEGFLLQKLLRPVPAGSLGPVDHDEPALVARAALAAADEEALGIQ
jgi:hypothetical protein